MDAVRKEQAGERHGAPLLLADRIARWAAQEQRFDSPIPGLILHRWTVPTAPTSYLLPASICLIGQGRKRLFLGEESYIYDAHRFLVTSVDLPVVSQVLEASDASPYLGLTLELDFRAIAQLILDRGMSPDEPSKELLGVAVSDVTPRLLDAFNRLIDLLDSPEDIPVLAPLIKQEIFYRLLQSEQGPRLRQITSVGHHGYRISRAIEWLKSNFSRPMKVQELASKAGLSLSAFHHHFRAVTSMSPLQYQKRMRLNEARRMMLTERIDVSSAAFNVGYESPSQFSREYSRQFGASPTRDIKQLIHDVAAL